MSTTENTTDRPNGHDTRDHLLEGTALETCFACHRAVSHDEYLQIQIDDRERIEKLENEIAARFLRERDAEIAEVERAADARVEKAQQDATKREATIRREAATAANAASAAKLAQAKKDADAQIKALKARQDTVIAERLSAEREAHERAIAGAVMAERATYQGEKLKLEGQLADMQRRLQAKTANAIGEPAEVDLHALLVAALPGDRISRVPKGQKGPDVIVEIIQGGNILGSIILDSKAHAKWSNRFTSKLRSDQLACGADWAILSSPVMPAGVQHLHVQDNVIVTTPPVAIVLTHLLRRMIVENYRLKRSAEDIDAKAAKLYSFILSPTYSDMLDGLLKRLGELDALHEAEVKDHHTAWKKRTGLTEIIRGVVGDFSAAVAAIIAGEAV